MWYFTLLIKIDLQSGRKKIICNCFVLDTTTLHPFPFFISSFQTAIQTKGGYNPCNSFRWQGFFL